MEEILKYFPNLTDLQKSRFEALGPLYREWNEKINVVSRKDIDNLYQHHVLHSLSISRFVTPTAGSMLLDIGTGGGFPGIPLAILWPECNFHLIDRIGKKIRVASSIAEALELKNVTFQHGDAGECHEKFDYVVSRGVTQLDGLIKIVRRNISSVNRNKLPNGLICLKGAGLEDETNKVQHRFIEVPLSDYFCEEYFETKALIYVQL